MEDWEHCGPELCGPLHALPEVYSNVPGEIGFVPGRGASAVKGGGSYRGTALA